MAAFDFPGVQNSLARARNVYGVSARIEIAAQRADEQKNRMLGELSETYETLLRTKKFLPVADADDIPDVIDRLKMIDPQHSLITDARTASGYAQEADRMVSEYNFDAATAVIDIGLQLAPENPALVNVQDRLNKERVVAGQRARSQELEAKLAPQVAAAQSAESFNSIASDLVSLAAIAPESPIIVRARANIQPVIEQQLAALQGEPKLAPLVALDTGIAPLLAAIGLPLIGDKITAAHDAAVIRVEQLVNGIADAIALGNLDSPANNSAKSQLAALRLIAPEDARADDFQVQLITAHMSQAQDQMLAGAWGEARDQIALAGELNPSPTLENRLKDELANIDTAERQSKDRLATENQQRAEEQKQARIADLENQLKADTAAAKTINDSRKILRKLSSLEAIAPGNALLTPTRETLAEKLSVATVASGKSSGDWDKALKEIKNIDSLFPKSEAIAAAQTEIQSERDKSRALAKQSEIESLRTNLKELATAKPDDSWSKNTTALLTKLTPLVPSSDPWLADMRNQLTDVYLAEAAKLQAAQRFTLAGQELDRAEKINPGAASIKQGRDSVKVALASFKSEQREKDTAARIAAHKQTFMAHIKSKQIASAKKTLALLRADLPGTDPFVKTEAPALLARAYLDFATSKNSQKDYAAAIIFADSGLQYAPKDKQLLAALETAKNELANAKKTAAAPPPKPVAPKPAPKVAKPVPSVPTQITKEQVFGNWCSDKIKLTLAANTFTFHLPGGGTAAYSVKQYDFGNDTFIVQWADKKAGTMETEFGKLTGNNSSLTQIRGRSVSENKWNDYNRKFNRCN